MSSPSPGSMMLAAGHSDYLCGLWSAVFDADGNPGPGYQLGALLTDGSAVLVLFVRPVSPVYCYVLAGGRLGYVRLDLLREVG